MQRVPAVEPTTPLSAYNTDDNDNDDDDDNNGVDLGLQGSERLRCRPGSSAIDMAIITCMPSHPGHKVED